MELSAQKYPKVPMVAKMNLEFGKKSSTEQSSISPKKTHVDSAKELALAGPLATALAVAQQSATGAALLGTAVLQVLTRRD